MSFVKKEITFFDKNNKKHRCLLDENKFHMEDYEGCTFIFDKIYSVDNGVRITKCDNNSDNTFVFLGCSFVFGDGLNDDETLPYYFSKLYKFKNNIINYGMSGQASNTALNILDNIMLSGFLSQNSTIKHCFYTLISEHIKRNFKYEDCETYSFCSDGFLYKNKKWYIPTKIGKVRYAFARSYIFKKIFVPFIEEKFYKYYEDYMIQSLKEMNKRVEDKYDSKLTIIVWPDKYSERFIKKLKETKLDLIFLPEYFNEVGTYKIKDDYHPTARANEEIAEILYNHINGNDKTN